MRNLQSLITDMKSTQIISKSSAQNATVPVIKELASTYADIIQEWILRLEEAERLINLQTTIRDYLKIFEDPNPEIDELRY